MSKLWPTVPAGSGVQKRARLNKEQAQPSARSPGTHWECACREAGKAAKGHAPAREEAESQWEQVTTQRHQGKGWRHPPNQSSTAAKRL